MVKVTVCIPSRNRQKYCIETIKSLAKSDQQNIEFIIGDNSDDPEVMIDFFKTFDDPRFKFVPSENRTLAMVENWNRLPQYACGDWIIFIGDDDYVDPDLANFVQGLENKIPDVDVLVWSTVTYSWPDVRLELHRLKVPSGSRLHIIEKEEILRRVFYWENATDRITANPGVYHALQRRSLLEANKATFGGQYFVHQEVDYESICKTALLAQKVIMSERPFSVMGACAASNSAGVINPTKYRKIRHDTFVKELETSETKFRAPKDFPFHSSMGLTAGVGAAILWVIQEYDLDVKGWEKNFVKACKTYCEAAPDLKEFKKRKRDYSRAIRQWHDGIHMSSFRPTWQEKKNNSLAFQGYIRQNLVINPMINNAKTPGQAFDAVRCVLSTPEFLLDNISAESKAA